MKLSLKRVATITFVLSLLMVLVHIVQVVRATPEQRKGFVTPLVVATALVYCMLVVLIRLLSVRLPCPKEKTVGDFEDVIQQRLTEQKQQHEKEMGMVIEETLTRGIEEGQESCEPCPPPQSLEARLSSFSESDQAKICDECLTPLDDVIADDDNVVSSVEAPEGPDNVVSEGFEYRKRYFWEK